jgi:ATP-dependent DNA ligase
MDLELPNLYSKSKTGKHQIWSIFVAYEYGIATIITTHGFLDGKKIISEKVISTGKNIGKANETSVYEQALSEAKSKWNKKKDQGYIENLSMINVNSKKIILPMLALDYKKRGKDIIFPCFVQPKIDGVRAIFNNGKLQSRLGKFFPHLEHITDELDTNLLLDGEIYSTTLTFQELTGIIKKQKLNKDDLDKLKQTIYLVYDVVLKEDYSERYKKLQEFFKEKFKFTSLLKTEICQSSDDVNNFHKKYVEKGYEGLILRNFLGNYEIKNRSKNLQKFKNFMDSEFKIIGATEGTGIETGLVIWICETKSGDTFNVRPQGTHEERKKLYKNHKKYIGKMLTVSYFSYTDDGIPRFPVGIAIRDFE